MIGITRGDGSTIHVEFQHVIEVSATRLVRSGLSRGETSCALILRTPGQKWDEGKILAHGDAICSMSDHYCKETGRKISLLRAVDQAVSFDEDGITCEEREQILTSYFKRPRGQQSTKQLEVSK